jgi:hypothetical protein
MATRTQCLRALREYEDSLSQKANVTGLGIVTRQHSLSADRTDLAVAVYVGRKCPADELATDDIIPDMLFITDRRQRVGVPVRVIEHGPFELHEVDRS